jgi:hypothetical protein
MRKGRAAYARQCVIAKRDSASSFLDLQSTYNIKLRIEAGLFAPATPGGRLICGLGLMVADSMKR